jgi:Spy/CpxP family protein refolding chaperone
MKLNKIIKKIVFSSLIAVIGTLSMAAFVPWSLLAGGEKEFSIQRVRNQRGFGGDYHHGRRHRALQFLDLTEEQEALIQEIQETHQADRDALHTDMKLSRQLLHDAVFAEVPDETAINEAAINLGLTIGDQVVLRRIIMNEIKAVLTPEQIERWEEMKSRRRGIREDGEEAEGEEGDSSPA